MNKRRVWLWVVTVCLLAALIPSTVFAATNGWNQNSDGTWSYYNGGWYKNTIVFIDGANYGFDANGIMYQNQWYQSPEGSWFYFDNEGKLCNGDNYLINGKYYGFHHGGALYQGQTFSRGSYNSALGYGVYTYYRAKADGSLYVNTWHKENGNWYYYGAKGAGVGDFLLVNGKWYFFEEARMVTDELVWSDRYQAYYYIKSDGTSSVKAPATGWLAAGDDYYYFANKQMYRDRVFSIGGKYYGFDGDGKMYKDAVFTVSYYEKGKWVSATYRAKADGTLCVNEWYQSGKSWYYYGAAGVAANDLVNLGGTWYFFEDGRMATESVVWSEQYKKYYAVDASGKASEVTKQDGWVSAGQAYYYFEYGHPARYMVIKSGNAYYGFDYDGKMHTSQRFSSFYRQEGDGLIDGYFCAKEDGSLYVNEWYQEDENWYYYGANGVGADGFTQLGGAWYFFENGQMITNRLVYSYEYRGNYIISADGKSSKKVTGDGWVAVGSDYYYVDGGWICKNEVRKIGGKYYGFNEYGRMYRNEVFYDYTGIFRAKADGSLYVNAWCSDGGEWYYYGAAGVGCDGFVTVGGVRYFFRDAKMVTNEMIYSKDDKGYYVVNGDGTVFTKVTGNGWVCAGDRYYYMSKNKPYTDGIYTIGGVKYGFDADGRMFCNEAFVEFSSDGETVKYYRAKADGSLYRNSWYQENGQWYYYGADGAGLEDFAQVKGVWYFFREGRMVTNAVVYSSAYNACYVIGANGTSSTKVTSTGWLQVGSNWYYFKSGGMMVTGAYTIGGKTYQFADNGVWIA